MTKKRNILHKLRRTRTIAISTVLLLFITLSSVIRFHSAIANAFTLATTHQPESYTVLSFNSMHSLPLFSKPNTAEHFSFHLANYENTPETYLYRVTLQDGSRSTIVDYGSVYLNYGESIDKPETYKVTAANHPLELTVVLIGRSEHIGFGSHS